MKLIIDIPDYLYDFVKIKRINGIYHVFDSYDAIKMSKYVREGTPLEESLENQKTGHWINRHNIYANKTFDTKVCSECQYEYSYDAETGISNANFCPNCGAKMKGE